MSEQVVDAANVALSDADAPYLSLVRRCPLRPIRTEAELDRAISVLNWLIDKGVAEARTSSEEDYMDVLGDLVEAYEEEHLAGLVDNKD